MNYENFPGGIKSQTKKKTKMFSAPKKVLYKLEAKYWKSRVLYSHSSMKRTFVRSAADISAAKKKHPSLSRRRIRMIAKNFWIKMGTNDLSMETRRKRQIPYSYTF